MTCCCKHSSPGRIELRALRKVCEGEELTVSYLDVLEPSAERQRKLKQRFHFLCSCQHCQQHLNDHMMVGATHGADGGKVSEARSEAPPTKSYWLRL